MPPWVGMKLKLYDAPADVTVRRGSRSRDDKKAIKNGTSARLLTAPSALFDVSLYFDLSDNPKFMTATLRAGSAEARRRGPLPAAIKLTRDTTKW
jgi:hypothetical protein